MHPIHRRARGAGTVLTSFAGAVPPASTGGKGRDAAPPILRRRLGHFEMGVLPDGWIGLSCAAFRFHGPQGPRPAHKPRLSEFEL